MALHPLATQRSDSCNRNRPENDISEKLASDRDLLRAVAGDDAVNGDDWISPTDMALLNNLKSESPSTTYHHIKRLPSGTKPVRLVGEGAANAVFEIKVPRGNEFKDLLLRVAKVPKLGQVTKYDYLFQQQFFQTAILPILGEYAVHQELVILHKSGIVEELNNLLQHINHERKAKFRDTFVGLTGWGLVVEDMRPERDVTLVEFKPKWLSQSPSAPKTAIRCRQCALELRYLITKPDSDRPLPIKKPCPLTIANADAPSDIASPLRVAPRLASESTAVRDAVTKTLNHPILQELRIQQELHDSVGPLNAKQTDSCFAIAMTIRDCTCFAQIARNSSLGDEPRKIRFGDLDWKDPSVKFDHWHSTEVALIDGGFYTAESILCGGKLYRPPTLCLLERTSTAKTGDVISVDEPGGINGNVLYHKANVAALKERLNEHEKTT